MASTHNFRKLTIWREGIEIAKETYATTKIFPKTEAYGLSSQLQRSAVSIPSNIAEGTARSTINISYNTLKMLLVQPMNGKLNLSYLSKSDTLQKIHLNI